MNKFTNVLLLMVMMFSQDILAKVGSDILNAKPAAGHVCNVFDTERKNIVFNYTIPSFLVNDSICDCCDCSDESRITGENFCQELINEYETVLVKEYLHENLLKGRAAVFEKVYSEDERFDRIFKKLNENKEMLTAEHLQYTDLDFVKDVKLSINDYWKEIMASSENFHDEENYNTLNHFFDKELPIIMTNDKSAANEQIIKKEQRLLDLKALVNKFKVVKLLISIKEEESGIQFKNVDQLLKMDEIIEKYGSLYFESESIINKIRNMFPSLNSFQKAITDKIKLLREISDLDNQLNEWYDSCSKAEVKEKIREYLEEKNDERLVSQFGKYKYVLDSDRRLYQIPLSDENENVYLIGELSNSFFSTSEAETMTEKLERLEFARDIVWKQVQNKRTNYLHRAIPSLDSSMIHDIVELNNELNLEFSMGDKCWRGPSRSAKMRMHCSSSLFEVIEVLEISKCKYLIDVNSVFGCI